MATAAPEPLVLVVDAHGLIASSLAVALRHSGFGRVATADPVSFGPDGDATPGLATAGDIVLLDLLHGDGRTSLPLIGPLAQGGCRVMVMTSDHGLALVGECLHRGAEAVLNKAMSFERLVEVLRRLRSGGCAMTDGERTTLLDSVDATRRPNGPCISPSGP